MSDLKDKTAKGLLWGGISNGLIQVLGALFGIVLLRILSPGDYGKIAVLIVYANIASNLQESGFMAALIRMKEPRHEDYNAVFWFNIIVSVVIYVILWFAAPLIASFNHEPVLTPLARYLFLGFVFSAMGTVQRAYLQGHLLIKQQSIISLVALILSNVIGVVMALMGFAFWGLATQTVSFILFTMLMDWWVSPWRPSLKIDLRPAWRMFGFSSKLLVTNLFNQLNSQVFSVLLGKYYNTYVVGVYSNARKWNDMAVNTICGMLQGVSLPVLAQVADDDERYRQVFRKMLRFASFVSFPCMFGLALISREFILITVGQKWADSATLLSMLCFYGAFFPLTSLYSSLTISRGHSGMNMVSTIVLCILVWIGLIVMHPYGIYHMVTYFITVNILWLFVWHWFAWRIVRLRLLDVLKDIMPFCLLAGVVMVATALITSPITNIYLCCVAKVVIAVLLYVGLVYLSGARILRESIDYIRHKKV